MIRSRSSVWSQRPSCQGWAHLAPVLGDCGPLALLHATGDEIGEAAATHIGGALPRCAQLTSLCLSRNPLGDPGAVALAGGLAARGALASLTLVGRCRLTVSKPVLNALMVLALKTKSMLSRFHNLLSTSTCATTQRHTATLATRVRRPSRGRFQLPSNRSTSRATTSVHSDSRTSPPRSASPRRRCSRTW